MKYLLLLDIPDDRMNTPIDDSIENVARIVNDALIAAEKEHRRPFTMRVRPLSEEIAC